MDFENMDIKKIEFAIDICRFFKEYYFSTFQAVFGFGDGGEYKFIKKLYLYLDSNDEMLIRIYDILQQQMFIAIEELDLSVYGSDERAELEKEIDDIQYIQDKLREYIN